MRIASNLIALVRTANVSELASLEKLVGELSREGHVQRDVLSALWSYFAMADTQHCTEQDAQCAIMLLAYAAK